MSSICLQLGVQVYQQPLSPVQRQKAQGQRNSGNGSEELKCTVRILLYGFDDVGSDAFYYFHTLVGPVMEAFGFERIIFGSSPPKASRAGSQAGDWYNVARESLAELGVEQECIDSVFSLNAQFVYGSK